MSKTRTPYTSLASPWNKRHLLMLWAVQIGIAVFVSAFSGGMLNRKLNQRVSDDGMSNGFYTVTVAIHWGVTTLSLILVGLKAGFLRRNKLYPFRVVIIDSVLVFFWLVSVSMAVASLAITLEYVSFDVFHVIEILCILAGLPFLLGLIQASRIYDTERKIGRGIIEIQSIDSDRKTLT